MNTWFRIPQGFYGVYELLKSGVLSLFIIKSREFCKISGEWGEIIKMCVDLKKNSL